MGKNITFILRNEALDQEFGTVTFNGKFVFELSEDISPEKWQKIGFIPLEDDKKKVESDDLFYYLNSRLPMHLRDENPDKKVDYIKKSGLKVASDSFVLQPA